MQYNSTKYFKGEWQIKIKFYTFLFDFLAKSVGNLELFEDYKPKPT